MGLPGTVGEFTTICEAVGVPTIVAAAVPKRTETGLTLKFVPKSVTAVPTGPNLGLNWFGEATKAGAGGGITTKPPTLVTLPPAV